MMNILKNLGIVESDTNTGFKTAPAIIMMALMVAFVGTTVYILISSMS